MKTFISLLIFAVVLSCVAAGKNKLKESKRHRAEGNKVTAPSHPVIQPLQQVASPVINLPPPIYKPASFQFANVYLNRFPGGVNYNHHVNGHRSSVRVNFLSYPSSKLSYKDGHH